MEKVFLTLLNMSITAGWIVLAVVLLRLVMKKAPKGLICFLWLLVGIRLVCPFTVESVISLIPSAETVPENIVISDFPAINSGISLINYAVNPVISHSLAPTSAGGATPMQNITFAASVVWLAGIAAMLLYMIVSYAKIRRKVREAAKTGDNIWQCDNIATPFILGVFRPRIYLPSALNVEDADYVISHENAHLKRRDHIWKPLGFLLLTVYWFNPLMWVAYVLLSRDIELACDEKVLRERGEEIKKPYSDALINCSVPRRSVAACPLAFGEVGVKSRIKNVLNYKKPALWVIITALAACAVLTACMMTDPVAGENEWLSIGRTGEYIGDGLTSYDGSVGKYRLLLVFNDALRDNGGWLDTYHAGEAVRITDRLTLKTACPDDSSLYVYLGSDTPFTVDGAEKTKSDANGKISISINYSDAAPDVSLFFDIATVDIDNDGKDERCVIGYGPTSGVFTFAFTVYENDLPKYSGLFKTDVFYDSLTVSEDETGSVGVRAVEQNGEVHHFEITLREDIVILSENGAALENLALPMISSDGYLGLDHMKGLELYVWAWGSDNYRYGLMTGTNRAKDVGEILRLYPATLSEMKKILATYDLKEVAFTVIAVQNPLSSYLWQPEKEELENIRTELGLPSDTVIMIGNGLDG